MCRECVDELQRRRDCILDGLPGWPVIRPAGGWSLLLDVAALGFTPDGASRLLLDEAGIAATPMTGWGDAVAARHVRLVFSAEPLEPVQTLPERLASTKLAAAAVARRELETLDPGEGSLRRLTLALQLRER